MNSLISLLYVIILKIKHISTEWSNFRNHVWIHCLSESPYLSCNPSWSTPMSVYIQRYIALTNNLLIKQKLHQCMGLKGSLCLVTSFAYLYNDTKVFFWLVYHIDNTSHYLINICDFIFKHIILKHIRCPNTTQRRWRPRLSKACLTWSTCSDWALQDRKARQQRRRATAASVPTQWRLLQIPLMTLWPMPLPPAQRNLMLLQTLQPSWWPFLVLSWIPR